MPPVRTNVVELYMANSVEELNNLAELPPGAVKTSNPRLLINTADKLFEQAVELKGKGDEEKSYLSFMKYMNLVSCIRKLPDYRKDKEYYNKLLGAKRVANAIAYAEELQKILQQRYGDKMEEKEVAKKFEAMELKLAQEREEKERRLKENKEKEAKEAAAALQKEEPVNTISSWDLKNLIDQKSTSFIIFDVRSQEDFLNSRINHPNCYNIPEKEIKAGSSAAMLQKNLPLDTQVAWSKRLTADVIIFVDWFGKREPGSPIFILEEIFTKWDPSSVYKGVMKLLIGGYDEWISRFPTFVINPRVVKPVQPFLPIDSTAVMNIDYPDLDDEPKKPPEELPARPVINRSTKPVVDVPADIPPAVEKPRPPEPNRIQAPIEVVPESKIPTVNRQSKSKAVAVYLKAEEEAMEKSLQIAKRALEQENEWDKLRLKKEVEADLELKSQLQEREEELIQRLKKFESDYREQEEQIEQLRQQVKEYESREGRNADPAGKGEAILIEDRIRKKEEERSSIYRNVELLRQQRKEKEEAERRKRGEEDEATRIAEEKRKEEMARRMAAEELKRKEEVAKRAEEQKRKEEAARKTEEEHRRKLEEEARSKKEEAERYRRQEEQRRKLAVDEMDKKKLERREESRRNAEMPPSTFRMGTDRLKDEPSLNSKLNRSHSTPDLAQAIDNEAKESRKLTPSVQRALKPLTTNRTEFHPRPEPVKNRNFAPVMGRAGRALTGLKNLGNTCYMNSILQCISYTTVLTRFFVEENYRKFLNRSSRGTRGDITEELAAVLKALWSGQYRSISCKDFKNAVGKYKSSFSGYEQQDSHEFLTILVDWLHEELNERIKEPLKEQNNCGIPDEKAARMAWNDYLKSNQSVIVSVFGGQQRSSLKCSDCGQESVTFEPFFNLSLPIPESAIECSLMECFKLYTEPEQVSGWSCPNCKKKRQAVKKIDIWKLPPVLVIHLQRFYNDGSWKKRFTNVEYDVTDLNLERVVKSQDARYTHFNLYAVSNHYGTMNGGHYTAYCRNVDYDRWYKFDDCNVMELKGREVRSSNAYILFYTARDYQVPQVAALDG